MLPFRPRLTVFLGAGYTAPVAWQPVLGSEGRQEVIRRPPFNSLLRTLFLFALWGAPPVLSAQSGDRIEFFETRPALRRLLKKR